MILDGVNNFLRGATMMADLGVALFFLRYGRSAQDRFFLFLSAAFFVMAISQSVMLLCGDSGEFAPYGYYLRLAAFVLICVGIIEKNLVKRE